MGNTKKLILDINAVESAYVESCYEIFMSSYKKSNNNNDITDVSDLPFAECVSFLTETSRWHHAWRIDNQYVTQNNLKYIESKFIDAELGSDSNNM